MSSQLDRFAALAYSRVAMSSRVGVGVESSARIEFEALATKIVSLFKEKKPAGVRSVWVCFCLGLQDKEYYVVIKTRTRRPRIISVGPGTRAGLRVRVEVVDDVPPFCWYHQHAVL